MEKNILEKEESYNKEIINNVSKGILVVDKNGIIIGVNKSYLEEFEKDIKDILGKKCSSISDFCKLKNKEDCVSEISNKYYEITENQYFNDLILKAEKEIEFYISYGKENQNNYLVNLFPIVENKNVEKIVFSFFNISHIKNMNLELLKFKQLIEQTPISIIITDTIPNIQYVNKQLVELTGYAIEELKGKNPRIFQSGQTNPEIYTEMWEKIKAGEVWQGEFINKKKNGEIYYEFAVISPIKNFNGEIINFAALKRDITTEKELQLKLEQSQKLEILGYVAGGIAHDFNNILTAILGFTDIAANQSNLPEKVLKYLLEIEKAAERATSLTKQLLAFSRKSESVPQPIDIKEFFNSFEKMVKRIIGEDIELKIKTEDNLLPIYGDISQLEQVLMNLVVNASHSLREKQINEKLISVFVGNEEINSDLHLKNGIYSKIKVKDNGCGIPEEIIDKIFNPFFTTKKKGEGTGLGLSMVMDIVNKVNGKIEVNSKIGDGSEFVIYWPCSKEKVKEKTNKNLKDYKTDFTKLKILIVEDELTLKDLAKKMLEKVGCEVIVASNGIEALDIVKEQGNSIDIIFTDIILPKLDGAYVGKVAKEKFPNIKVFYCTGYTDDIIEKYNINRENLLVIEKPYSQRQLLDAIELLMK